MLLSIPVRLMLGVSEWLWMLVVVPDHLLLHQGTSVHVVYANVASNRQAPVRCYSALQNPTRNRSQMEEVLRYDHLEYFCLNVAVSLSVLRCSCRYCPGLPDYARG